MRVGGFNPAPVLEPQLGAFFWITPIPADWPKERVESKLREYNFYNLWLLVIHEAMPGHYVQGEFANDIQPKTRRVLRALFGNGPYVEGWAAVYYAGDARRRAARSFARAAADAAQAGAARGRQRDHRYPHADRTA